VFNLQGFGVVDIPNNISKPFVRNNFVLLAGSEKIVIHGEVVGGIVRTGNRILLAPQSQMMNRMFVLIVVHYQIAAFEVINLITPKCNAKFKRFSDWLFG